MAYMRQWPGFPTTRWLPLPRFLAAVHWKFELEVATILAIFRPPLTLYTANSAFFVSPPQDLSIDTHIFRWNSPDFWSVFLCNYHFPAKWWTVTANRPRINIHVSSSLIQGIICLVTVMFQKSRFTRLIVNWVCLVLHIGLTKTQN